LDVKRSDLVCYLCELRKIHPDRYSHSTPTQPPPDHGDQHTAFLGAGPMLVLAVRFDADKCAQQRGPPGLQVGLTAQQFDLDR
jgi:hypothetical protein